MSKRTRIVLLNGVGSAGKSSIAKALQAITSEPFLHVQMDAFLDMLPVAYQDHPDTFTFKTSLVDGKPLVAIGTGPVGERLMQGMHRAVAALAQAGNNLIVDDVLTSGMSADYAVALAPFQLFLVGVFAPLEVLEARERQRGDRLIGLARWQYDRVHKNMKYDLEVDASTTTPAACARLIKDRLRL